MELRCMLILLFLCVSVCKFVFLYTPPYISQKKTCTRSDRSLGDKKSITLKATFFHFFVRKSK